MTTIAHSGETISLFCRLNINTKKELPVRSSEMGLLIFVSESAEPPTSLDAVAFFHVSKPMVAGMVRSLESKGYLCRGESRETRRRFTLLLTAKGKQLVDKTTGEYGKTMALLQKGLGKMDFAAMISLLERANKLLLASRENQNTKSDGKDGV